MGVAPLSNPGRVEIWNSFFHLAIKERNRIAGGRLKKSPRGSAVTGRRLSQEKESILAALAFSVLSIEARVNHILDELLEADRIERPERDALVQLRAEDKWFLIPRLADKRPGFRKDTAPHQAICSLCATRNDLVHVNYAKLNQILTNRFPTPHSMITLFGQFVRAMEEDMNVLLGRARHPRKAVLRHAKSRTVRRRTASLGMTRSATIPSDEATETEAAR